MKLNTTFSILFLFVSFVFSIPVPSAVDDIVPAAQKQKTLLVTGELLAHLKHATDDPDLLKLLNKAEQGLENLSETQDPGVEKSFGQLEKALPELQAFLDEIKAKAPLDLENVGPTEGKEKDKRSGVEPAQQEEQKAQGPEESLNGLGPRNLGTEAGKAGKNLGVETGGVGKNLGVVLGKTGKGLGLVAGGTGKNLGLGAGKGGKNLGVGAAKAGISIEELLAKLVSILN